MGLDAKLLVEGDDDRSVILEGILLKYDCSWRISFVRLSILSNKHWGLSRF